MRAGILYGLLVALTTLAACSLTPRDTGEAYMFSLSPARVPSEKKADVPLVVALPSAATELDTARVALLRDQKVWDYYAGAKWAGFLPVMVQDNLVRTLDAAGMFQKVGADDSGLGGKYALRTEIRAFHADYTPRRSAPVIRLWLAASLVNRLEDKVIETFEIREQKSAGSDSLPAVQTAFQGAFAAAQTALAARLRRAAESLPPPAEDQKPEKTQ